MREDVLSCFPRAYEEMRDDALTDPLSNADMRGDAATKSVQADADMRDDTLTGFLLPNVHR